MKKLFDRILLGLHWHLAITPVSVLICLKITGTTAMALPLLPAFILLCLCPMVKFRKTSCAVLALATVAVYAWRVPPVSFTSIAFLVGLSAILGALLPRFMRPRGQSLNGFTMVLFGALHLVAMIVMKSETFAPAKEIMGLYFAAFLLMSVFSMNTASLCNAMGEEKSPSVQLLAGNRVVLGLLCIPVVIGSCWQSLAAGVNWIWEKFKWLISLLMSVFQREEAAETASSGTGGGMGFTGMGEQAAPSQFWLVLEQVLKYLGYAVLVAAVLYVLYRLARKIPGWLRILAEKLKKYMGSLDLDYEDKKESLFRWDTLREDLRNGLKKRLPRPRRKINWGKLNPREQVRAAYGEYRDVLRETGSGATAQEVLHRHLEKDAADQASEIYNRARYSAHEVTPDDANKMRTL